MFTASEFQMSGAITPILQQMLPSPRYLNVINVYHYNLMLKAALRFGTKMKIS